MVQDPVEFNAAPPLYPSRFGGLWPDRRDAAELLAQKLRQGVLDETGAARIREWMERGVVVIEDAVDPEIIAAYDEELSRLVESPDPRILVHLGRALKTVPMERGVLAPENSARILDHYVFSELARGIAFSPPIERFLSILFEQPPLIFQSLGFEYGSQQGIHQDTAYVVVDEPMTIVGVWIALEDVTPGAGELEYFVGSHRLPEYLFSGQFKHWHPQRDGQAAHDEWGRKIHENAAKMKLERVRFLPKKGTVLFWHADLAHGGTVITKAGTTRRSFVGHYCPVSVSPYYFQHVSERHRGKVGFGGSYLTSMYYPVLDQEPLRDLERY